MSLIRRVVSHPVTRNTLGLYGVQIAGYVIPLTVLPYLARILRPQGFGLLLFAQSFALWASVTIEYGFSLSATREVARNRQRRDLLALTAAGVLGGKLILSLGFVVIFGIAAWVVPTFRSHPVYLLWALPQGLALGFSPFWYFQGIERMLPAVSVELLTRAGGAILIFIGVRVSGAGWKVLAIQAATSCLCLIVQTTWMYSELDFRWPTWEQSLLALRSGRDMFFFRGAYHVYSSANAFILGLFTSPLKVGYFGGGERIAKAVQGLTLPLTQALYPRMSHLTSESSIKAARVARLTIIAAAGIGLILGGALALSARWLDNMILGPSYQASIAVLHVFALVLPVNAVNTALIMQWMLPKGLEQAVSRITLMALALNVTAAALFASRFGELGMVWAILAAESAKSAALIFVLWRKNLTPMNVLREKDREALELEPLR